MKLLTTSNPKTAKSVKYGYLSAVLHLSPYDASGVNVCPMADLASCWQGCLNTAGRGGIAVGRATMIANGITLPDNAIQACRLRRTALFHQNWPKFFGQLVAEIEAHGKRACRLGLLPAIRLNGTSDLRWETLRCEGKTLPEIFPRVQFYDYTKIPNRKSIPENYYLALSYSGASPKYADMIQRAAVEQGRNLVVVFRKKLPDLYLGRQVINGDVHDLRFLDAAGIVVGLKAKGKARGDTSGFVVDVDGGDTNAT